MKKKVSTAYRDAEKTMDHILVAIKPVGGKTAEGFWYPMEDNTTRVWPSMIQSIEMERIPLKIWEEDVDVDIECGALLVVGK